MTHNRYSAREPRSEKGTVTASGCSAFRLKVQAHADELSQRLIYWIEGCIMEICSLNVFSVNHKSAKQSHFIAKETSINTLSHLLPILCLILFLFLIHSLVAMKHTHVAVTNGLALQTTIGS